MIEAGAEAIAAAIAASMATAMPGAVVDVYAYEPATAAAPCVWLQFLEARYQAARWTITYTATIVADAGLDAIDAQRQLAAMTDAVLELEAPGVVAQQMVARGGGLTTRIGDTAHPVHQVTIPQATTDC